MTHDEQQLTQFFDTRKGTLTGRISSKDPHGLPIPPSTVPSVSPQRKPKVHVIGLTGSQNTGKSTVLEAIARLNLSSVIVDSFSVPRSVQADLNRDLKSVVDVATDVPDFQDRILARKAERVVQLRADALVAGHDVNQDVWVFTDRTPIDFAGYARTWVEKNKEGYEWLIGYQGKCKDGMADYDLVLFFPVCKEIDFVAEDNRGSKESQASVDHNCKEFVHMYCGETQVCTVPYGTVDARVQQCLNLASYLGTS